jgi:transcriptional regulator with XRE-family HTH domain
MNVAETLRAARQTAGLTQRQLAARAAVPQSTVARIERGQLTPRVDLFDELLRAADSRLAMEPLPGQGVDRTQFRDLLRLTPSQRFDYAVRSANNLARLLASAKKVT